MCIKCDRPHGAISHFEIPLKFVIAINKKIEDAFKVATQRDYVNKREWFKVSDRLYICAVTYYWYDDMYDSWHGDILEFHHSI